MLKDWSIICTCKSRLYTKRGRGEQIALTLSKQFVQSVPHWLSCETSSGGGQVTCHVTWTSVGSAPRAIGSERPTGAVLNKGKGREILQFGHVIAI